MFSIQFSYDTEQMDLYFDTNVYNFIADRGDSDHVREFLKSRGHNLIASADNLFELLKIRDDSLRRSKMSVLTSVATSFERQPDSYIHAFEIQCEIRRCRRHWLRSSPRKGGLKAISEYKQQHLSRWNLAKQAKLPLAHEFADYHRDSENGIASQSTFQKWLKKEGKDSKSRITMQLGRFKWDVDYSDAEQAWRSDCLMVWYHAIVMQNPSSRDYFDWLDPYLIEDAFYDSSYPQFWLRDVKAERVPYSRVTGLAAFYQLEHKITHGNAIDVLHASKMLSSDVFLTADRGLFHVLGSIGLHFNGGIAKPALVNQSSVTAVDGIRTALESVSEPAVDEK